MMVLITGGSASGKSEYAEKVLMMLSGEQDTAARGSCETAYRKAAEMDKAGMDAGRRFYFAAMQTASDDEEGKERIERHRRMRADKNFITVESQRGIREHAKTAGINGTDSVLLECLSNLTANEMFSAEGYKAQVSEGIFEDLIYLKGICKNLVIVTNEIFSDGICYEKETEQYQKELGALNVRLASEADAVAEVVCKIPLYVKGEIICQTD